MNFRKIWISQVHADASQPPQKDDPEPEPEPELVDPQVELRERCGKKREIYRLYKTLQECNDRVNSREKTQETCLEEIFDYVYALDHCVAKSLFARLK